MKGTLEKNNKKYINSLSNIQVLKSWIINILQRNDCRLKSLTLPEKLPREIL